MQICYLFSRRSKSKFKIADVFTTSEMYLKHDKKTPAFKYVFSKVSSRS